MKIKHGFHILPAREKNPLCLSSVPCGRNKMERTFPFLPIPLKTPSFMIKCKLDYRSRKQKRKNQLITMLVIKRFDWFILPLPLPTRLRRDNQVFTVSDGVIKGTGV